MLPTTGNVRFPIESDSLSLYLGFEFLQSENSAGV